MSIIKKIYEWFYYLIDSPITKEEGDRIARVKTKKTKTIDDIADRIVLERTEYRKDTIVSILKMVNEVKLEFFTQGEMVNDGIVIFEPAITGTFVDTTTFDEKKNTCVINTRVTNDVLRMAAQVKGTYNGLTVENGGASIEGIVDSTTGATNGEVTPGKVITINGKKIRMVPEEGETVESCITYTDVATGLVINQNDPPVINDPSKLVMQLPALNEGSYTLTLKTLFSSNSTTLKAPRYITFKTKLTVK